MKFVDRVKVFYLYNLRFLRNRQFIRALKTATGIGVLTGTSYWYYTQLNAAIEEKKQRRTGRDSLIAAGVLSQVSGYGENKLAPGKTLQDMIDNVEKKAQTPFENIRTPRPWEIDTDEHKRKYMKAAHIEVEQKIDRREAEKDQEEARIKAEIEAIKRKNSQKLSPAAQSE
jgi:hypothetical protein